MTRCNLKHIVPTIIMAALFLCVICVLRAPAVAYAVQQPAAPSIEEGQGDDKTDSVGQLQNGESESIDAGYHEFNPPVELTDCQIVEGSDPLPQVNACDASEDGEDVAADIDVEPISDDGLAEEPVDLAQTGLVRSNAADGENEAPDSAKFVLADAALATTDGLSSQASGSFVIVIDPGHGGYDGGASGYVEEKGANLTIATYLRKELAKYSGVKVYMTRTDDTYVGLGDRVQMAVNWGANLVVSIHNNSGGGKGAEVIVPNSSSWYYDACYVKGQELGGNIMSELKGVGLSQHQGVYSRNSTDGERYADGSMADYYWLVRGPRQSGILGIIVEHAFVDNATDAGFLQGDANLRKLALADAAGIARTYGLTKAAALTPVEYEAPLAAGTYAIATSANSQQVLDVSGGSKANGANVLLWNWHNVAWQKWEVSYDDYGLYTIKNANSGKVLDVAGADAFMGTNVLSWQGKSTDYYNQRWVLVKSGIGYVIKSALDTDYVLDCWGGSSANGTNIALWDAHGGANQRFCFVNLNPNVAYGQTIADGIYTMGVSNKQTQLVEVEGNSIQNCGNVDLYAVNGGTNQQWSFRYNGEGLYKIINVRSGLALDVEGASVTAGANVLQYAAHSGKNQLWGIAKNSDGTYSIYSALNGLAIDVHGASVANLANVETYYPNGGANQRFALSAVPGYEIMGTTTVTVAQMASYYASTPVSYPSSTYSAKGAATIDDFVNIAYEEARAEGVRAEVLFAQAMLETGNLAFGGVVSVSQCNFGGLGATGGGATGATFADVRQGLRAQVQHLKAYASTLSLNNACVDPRFNDVARGSAPTVEKLSGKWATDVDYGTKIVAIIDSIKKS